VDREGRRDERYGLVSKRDARLRFDSISVCFPVYNEEANIARAVRDVASVLPDLCDRPEIVAVDDASTDGTPAMLEQLKREVDYLRTVRLQVNTRFAGALKRALTEATGEVVIYTDADCPVDMADLHTALPQLEGVDVLAGFRINRDEGMRRTVYSRGYNLLIAGLFDLEVRDVNFAFKIFRRHVIEALDVKSRGSFIDAEILLEAHRMGFRIAQTGVLYHPRTAGESTLADLGIVARCARDALAYRFGLSPWSRGQRRRP